MVNPVLVFSEPFLRSGREDQREYMILAIKGTGVCSLAMANRQDFCKSGDHKHVALKRYGYSAAEAAVTYYRNNGWHVVSMDRTY